MRSATASPIRRHFGPFAGFFDIFFLIFEIRAMLLVFDDKAADRRRNEAGMVEEMAPARRRRIGAQGMILRRRRIFARLREGLSYDEIAGEEGVTSERIRQIVADVLQKRSVESGVEHAKLQLDRLAPVMQLAAEAVAAGDVTAIAPYLKVLDRFDRYQTVAGANQAYDEEARKKLFDKINRVAANLDVDEVMRAAAREHLRKLGMIPEEAATTEGDAAANPPPAAAEEKT
jgi:DNA-binding CsgD family transcriptional regulator